MSKNDNMTNMIKSNLIHVWTVAFWQATVESSDDSKCFYFVILSGSSWSNFRSLRAVALVRIFRRFSPVKPHHPAGRRPFSSVTSRGCYNNFSEWNGQNFRFYSPSMRSPWAAAPDCWWMLLWIGTKYRNFVPEKFKQKILSDIISTDPFTQTGRSLIPGKTTANPIVCSQSFICCKTFCVFVCRKFVDASYC